MVGVQGVKVMVYYIYSLFWHVLLDFSTNPSFFQDISLLQAWNKKTLEISLKNLSLFRVWILWAPLVNWMLDFRVSKCHLCLIGNQR